jgi:hypothetical protein
MDTQTGIPVINKDTQTIQSFKDQSSQTSSIPQVNLIPISQSPANRIQNMIPESDDRNLRMQPALPPPPFYSPQVSNILPQLTNQIPLISTSQLIPQDPANQEIDVQVDNFDEDQTMEGSESDTEMESESSGVILKVSSPEKGTIGQMKLNKDDISYISSDDENMNDRIIDITDQSQKLNSDDKVKKLLGKLKKKRTIEKISCQSRAQLEDQLVKFHLFGK